tara:strand:- start:77 stop:436 length:360 start_codon:yes stop_codon:yes gene_type:complete
MATLAHQSTANQVSFGQLGSVYTKSGSAKIIPPTGKVFVAITFFEDTKFDSSRGLIAEEATVYFNTEDAANDKSSADGEEGSGGLQISNTVVFPKGITIYGRYTEIDIDTGSCIAYISA